MTEFEVFRITPQKDDGKCYEYAESTRTQGRYPNEKYFTNTKPKYVGRLIKIETGGFGDGGWRRDYFEDNNNIKHTVNYSYEGKTCFREVPCLPANIPTLESLSRDSVKKNTDYSTLKPDDPMRIIINPMFKDKEGGKSKRRRSSKSKRRRSSKSKRRKTSKSKRRRISKRNKK